MTEANCIVVLHHEQGSVAAGQMIEVLLFDGLIDAIQPPVPRLQVRELQSPLAGLFVWLQAGQCLTIRGRSGAGKKPAAHAVQSRSQYRRGAAGRAARSITDERQRLRLERLTSR
jgi:hypothetical protein